MNKARKMTALLTALLLLTVLLCACGGTKCSICGKEIRGQSYHTAAGLLCESCYLSGANLGAASAKSNTGVWIAITVMVFIAVFSATSGVVYLVLQKVLPKEEAHRSAYAASRREYAQPREAAPVVRSTPVSRPQQQSTAATRPQPGAAPRPQQAAPSYRTQQPTAQTYRPQQTTSQHMAAHSQQPARPQPMAQANPRTYTGEWICTRDHSRNSGPFCVLCGAPRPRTTAPAANGANQQPTQRQYAQQPMQSQRPAQQYPQQPAQRPAQAYTPAQTDDFRTISTAQKPEPTARPMYQPPEEKQEYTYTGKFAKKTALAPEPVQPDSLDGDFNADLLEEILREAAESDGK